MPNSITGVFSRNNGLHDKALVHLSNVSFRENDVTFSIERIGYSSISQKQFVYEESLFIGFIGTLLNFDELREHLAIDVERDVDLIANMYLSKEKILFDKLQGLFTVVIYDIKKKCCIVIQDRLSSPLNLYYQMDENGIVFSTSLKKLLPLVKNERELDYRSVITFIENRFVSSKYTLVKEIHKLLPGEYLEIRNETRVETRIVKYKKNSEKFAPVSSCSEYNKIIENSVRSCFETLGEKNISLSSGYDSNAILQVAREMDSNPINAFTVGGKSGINEVEIENIFIFVSDALRYDFLPRNIENKGLCVKTIASSLYTASSFPSMISGLYPPKHRVYTWENKLSEEKKHLLNLDGYNTSLWCETTWTDSKPDESEIHEILGNPNGIPIEELKEPFIYIEDDKGGHCPFGLSFENYMGGGCPDFFKEYGKKGIEELRNQYKKGIKESEKNFNNRLKILKARGLLENTLVIFTSDHGELLGEYGGLVGHGRPACPELVYVPTVFIHPSLESHKFDQIVSVSTGKATDNQGVMRQVDLFPTICGLLNVDVPSDVDGINLLNANKLPETGLNFRRGGYVESEKMLQRLLSYEVNSVWDYHGGWIFHNFNRVGGTIYFLGKMLFRRNEFNFLLENVKGVGFQQKRRQVFRAIKHLTMSELKYHEPKFTKKEARLILDEYFNTVDETKREKRELDEITKERLKGLGYID